MKRTQLNILQTCFSRSWGGLEMQALEATLRLMRRGHNLWLACCPESRLEKEAKLKGILTLPFNVTGYVHPWIIWQLSNNISSRKIDIIHCQISKDIATIVPAMKLTGRRIPILLTKRVGSFLSKKDLFHKFTYAHVSRALAISEFIRRNILETTPMKSEHILTVYDAVDTEVFSPTWTNRKRIREEFHLDDTTIVIGMVGRFTPGKGHEEFLTAANILRRQYENVHFLIVGEASYGQQEYEEKIKKMAYLLGVEQVTTFTGFRNDIPDIMAAFDIFAFPSHAESFGMGLIEAMSMELPVVSTNCDGVLDIVVDGKTGLYVQPRNPTELAEALSILIRDANLRERFGKAGRERVLALFDEKNQTTKVEEVYYELLEVK